MSFLPSRIWILFVMLFYFIHMYCYFNDVACYFNDILNMSRVKSFRIIAQLRAAGGCEAGAGGKRDYCTELSDMREKRKTI